MSSALRAVASVEDLFRLSPVERFEALIAGTNFAPRLRAEPIIFDIDDPTFGYRCGIDGCVRHSTQAGSWCTGHAEQRRVAARSGVGEAAWKAAAVPFLTARASPGARAPCRFCPDRDTAGGGDLCLRHSASRHYARKTAGSSFDEVAWAADQHALSGCGPCRVGGCAARAEMAPSLCFRHRRLWRAAGSPTGEEFERWLPGPKGSSPPGMLALGRLPALLAAEIRYGLWAHESGAAPARWHPMWLRTFVRSCERSGAASLLDLEPTTHWTAQPASVNRILRGMRTDVAAVHRSRTDTRELGYLDTNHWGFRFRGRRSVFDLRAIPQRWLRDLTWDFVAGLFDSPKRPRTAGPVEQVRRSLVCLGAYLAECGPYGGARPAALTEATGREFVADLTRRVANRQPMRGVSNVDGSRSAASATTYALTMNGVRRVLRDAMDSGGAAQVGLGREFIVTIPHGGALSFRNPRPFSDPVLRELSDPANIGLLGRSDPHDGGLADIWSIQVRCGRRINEVITLRFDCVGEHLGRTWMWVDMTKVGKLDYAIQIPKDVYDVVVARQAKTAERFRLKTGEGPTATQKRTIALFPSRVANPTFERSLSASTFAVAFKAWIESDQMSLPGHTTHQARHTLATRLVAAGASMAHVKRVLGHVSERMGDSYVLIAGSQVEPFLQQVWVTGPGNPDPGQVVLIPGAGDKSAAEQLMVNLAAVPTEHGLCTFGPVVGGFDCPFDRQCHSCEHFVLTGADYGYWKRQEQRWAAMAEGAPDETARDYIYDAFAKSSQALAGLETALSALGLLEEAKAVDLRSPHQDFFDPIWRQGWRAEDLVRIGSDQQEQQRSERPGSGLDTDDDPAPV